MLNIRFPSGIWYMPDRRCLCEQLTGKTLGTISLMGLTWGERSHICYCLHCWRMSVFCVAPHEVDRAYGSLHLGPPDTHCLFYPCALNVCPSCVAGINLSREYNYMLSPESPSSESLNVVFSFPCRQS